MGIRAQQSDCKIRLNKHSDRREAACERLLHQGSDRRESFPSSFAGSRVRLGVVVCGLRHGANERRSEIGYS